MIEFFSTCFEKNPTITIGTAIGLAIVFSLVIVIIKNKIPAILR